VDFEDMVKQINIPGKLEEIEKEVFTKGPQEYSMPGMPYYEAVSKSTISLDKAKVIDEQFRLAYGVVEDFRRRLLVINSKIHKSKLPTTETMEQIPRILDRYYRNLPEYISLAETIELDLLDRFRIPKVPLMLLDFGWAKGRFGIKSFLDSSLKAIPVFYEVMMFPEHNVNKFITAIANGDIDKTYRLRELYDQVDEVVRETVRYNSNINDWFIKWMRSK
jgi:hypothetical protein